tara:strand:- start:1338 stop:1490 length:153 start_codon:yes stop_codon:yes gene_type:complete
MNNLDRIKEVLNLEDYYKRQKIAFRKRILSAFLAIALIIAGIYIWFYYGQ